MTDAANPTERRLIPQHVSHATPWPHTAPGSEPDTVISFQAMQHLTDRERSLGVQQYPEHRSPDVEVTQPWIAAAVLR